MPKKKKIIIAISSDLFVRNYLISNAFNEIISDNECFIIASEDLSLKKYICSDNNFTGFYKIPDKIKSKHYQFFNILMFKHRNKSKSFLFRFYRLLRIELLNYDKNKFKCIKNFIYFCLVNIVRNSWIIIAVFLEHQYVYEKFKKWFSKNFLINDEIKKYLENINPDLVIFPSSAFDPDGNILIYLCLERKIKTLFLIDNWDNLSSKSIFWKKPDYITVWGRQSKEHAISIHNISPEKIFLIGTPRFDHYYQFLEKTVYSHFNIPYILFVGCAIPFDETSALKILEETIENKIKNKSLKILYRPHPWRQSRIEEITFKEKDFKHILLDPQVSGVYKKSKTNDIMDVGFQPDINYYPSLIKNALFIVGPLTTMIIEALIFKKRVLALAYDDKIHFTSPDKAFQYFTHFNGLENIKGIQFCHEKNMLSNQFVSLLETYHQSENSHFNIDYFLYNNSDPYPIRLKKIVEKILLDS